MQQQNKDLKLSVLPGTIAICRLDPGSEIPSWALASSLLSISKTPDELSIVCDHALVPEGVMKVGNWRAFKVEGPLDFSLTGIVASISRVLADARIPIFVISTFDTDYILVQDKDFKAAKLELGAAFDLSE